MAQTMSTHARLLSLGLLASLGGAGHAMEPLFSAGSGPGLQIAVRLISDEAQQEQASTDDAEVEDSSATMPSVEDSVEPEPESAEQTGGDAPSTQASDTPSSEEGLPEDLGLPGQKGEDLDLAKQEEAGGTEDLELEEELERDPDLAGQGSLEEEQERNLARAEAILNRVDQILLDARAQARKEQDDGDGTAGSMSDEDSPAWETEGDAEGETGEDTAKRGGTAEGQVPGNVPTGKTRSSHGYDRDDDIVTRQVCELAEREEDPEVRKHLEEKCKSLQDG